MNEAIKLYTTLSEMGVSVPRMYPRHKQLCYGIERRYNGAISIYLADPDAIYIMCGVMEAKLGEILAACERMSACYVRSYKDGNDNVLWRYVVMAKPILEGFSPPQIAEGAEEKGFQSRESALLACLEAVKNA